MLRILVRFAVVAAFTVTAALPVAASADAGTNITIVIGRPITLQNKLLVTVPVTMTCPAPLTAGFQPGGLTVNIEQSTGRTTFSHGSGGVSFPSCSTTPQTFSITVTPDISPVPSGSFHRGGAILSASAFISDNNFPQTYFSGSVGWAPVRLIV